MKRVYVAKDYEEKQMQRAMLQFARPENAELIRKALHKCGRGDLIGYSPECLVKPPKAGDYRTGGFERNKKQNPKNPKQTKSAVLSTQKGNRVKKSVKQSRKTK